MSSFTNERDDKILSSKFWPPSFEERRCKGGVNSVLIEAKEMTALSPQCSLVPRENWEYRSSTRTLLSALQAAKEGFAMFSSSMWKCVSTAFALIAALGVLSSANAEESGHWKGRAVLVVINAPTVKVADSSDHQVSLSEMDGVIFNEGGQSFLSNARYQVVDLQDSGGMVSGGYKTFTAEGGSRVFAKYNVLGGSWPTFNGEWTFVGGTDKYKGISGKGKFTITWVSDTTAWDVLEGDYKIP